MTTANLPAVTVPLDELERMAHAVAKSGLFGLKTPDQAIALMLVAQSEGRHPAVAAQDYDIIGGRPAKKAEAMMRDFIRGGGKVEWIALTDTAAAATFTHPQGGSVTIDWDMKRATAAGLAGKDSWRKYPRSMLRSRVVSEGVRTVFPLATSGMYTPGEVADFDAPRRPLRDVTPKPEARQPADDLAAFAGENPPPAADAASFDPSTGEVADKDIADADERPHRIALEIENGVANWSGFCSDYNDALMAAEDEDTLLAIVEQNRDTMLALSSGGKGGRAAAERLRGTFTGCQIELRRRTAAA